MNGRCLRFKRFTEFNEEYNFCLYLQIEVIFLVEFLQEARGSVVG
jgi:hypothetical protein